MSPAKKKTKAAKSTARKALARATAAVKKAATKKKAAKTTKAKAAKATKKKAAKTTKAKAAKATKRKAAKATKPKAAKAKTSKAPAAAPKAPTAAPEKAAARKRAPSRRDRKKPAHAPASEVLPQRTPVAGEPRSKLGSKWECFSCGAKFYDLNKPEPLCPRCGANQLTRPKAGAQPKPPPPAGRAMAPLLDEDEDTLVVRREELDLGVAGVDEAVGDFIDSSESEEDSVDEEDDEP
jgi:hypothetical protein